MEFTSKEIKQIKSFLYKLDKNTKQWPIIRWGLLLLSLGLIGVSLYIYFKAVQISEANLSLFSLHETSMDIKTIENCLKGRLVSLELEFVLLLTSTFKGIFGAIIFVYTVIGWNRHVKSKIKAAILKKLVNEIEECKYVKSTIDSCP